MQEPSKTNQELIEENSLLKQRIQELEKSEVERKRLELLLKKAEQEFSVIFDSTPSLIWQKDLKGIYQQVNKAYCDTVGLSKDDILGKTDYDLFPTEIADKYASHDRNVLKSGISELGIEEYHKKPSGGYGWSSTDKFIYSDANGNPTGTIGFATNITKHKRTKEELWESEEKFKAIANYTVDWDSWFSLDGKYLWVNPAVENITGYSPEEVMAMTDFISVLIVKEYRDQFIERFQYALRGNRGENFEFQYLHKNGSKRWLSASWQPIYDAKGKPLGIRASGRDITDRKLAEVALQEKNERLSMSLEIGNAGIWEWYLKTDEIRLDDRFHAMLGYKPGELPNTRQEWLPYHHPEDMTAWMPKAEAYLRGDNPVYESEHRIRNKTGTWSWVFTRGKLVNLTSTESPEQFVGIAMDITERKIVEARYKSIFENATEGIYQTTLDGRYLSVNPSFARMFGYDSPEEMIKSVTDIGRQLYVNPEDRERLKKLLVEQDRVQNFTAQLYRKDGSKFWVSINVHTVKDAEDCILYLEGTNEDITDHKHAEEALISSEQRLADIIEFLPDATLVIDRDGKVLAWNQAIEIMTGVKAKDMLGKGDHEYALPFYGERRPILIDLALHPESEREISYTHIQKMGDILFGEAYTPGLIGGKTHLSATASVLRDAAGEIVAAIECIRDDTQRRRAQEELKSAEERYRSIFENAQEGIYRSTPEGRIILANKAMANMFGYKTPEELMTNVTDVARQFYVNPEERTKLIKIIEEQGTVVNHETQFHRNDGSVFWVSMTMQGVRDEKGQILYYEGIDEDITARKEMDERMRKSLVATVQAIAVIVETRDPYTAGHQRKVADLAQAIAMEMKLPSDRINGIRTASAIHDLGKISVPAEILSNPKKLTTLEFSLIKTHAQSGYDILKDIEFPWPVARMVREHHERMDGSGYPQGLIGEETLLESRILAVADVVESMASHRPYRPALGLDAALEEIENNKGTLYDADVVEACLRLFREKGYQLQEA